MRHRVTAHHIGVAALTAAAAALYSVYSLTQYATFRIGTYDLVIFDQAVRSYAHLSPGISIAKGVQDGFGTHFSVLGDHWSPVLAALVPLYWIHDAPQTLLVTQAVAFALAIPPLWAFTRRAAGSEGGGTGTVAAYCVAVAYALSWPIAEGTAAGFHEVAFVPVLTAVFFERLCAGRPRTALLAAGALLFVKEDMGLLVAGLGIWLLASRPRVDRQRLLGTCLVAAGLAATWIATAVLRPAFGGSAAYYWAYWDLGRDIPQAAWHVIVHPASTAHLLISPGAKLDTMVWLAGALLFLPLLSPISLAAVPLLAERMLAEHSSWWGVHFQYNSLIVAVLICGAVDGAARLSRWAARAGGGRRPGIAVVSFAGLAALLCAAAFASVPRFSLGDMLHPGFFAQTSQTRAAAAADAAVPSGVRVRAPQYLGPQLSSRDTVLLWGPGQPGAWQPGAPWVIADTRRLTFPFPSLAAQLQQVGALEHDGYQPVLVRDGYLVLHLAGRSAR